MKYIFYLSYAFIGVGAVIYFYVMIKASYKFFWQSKRDLTKEYMSESYQSLAKKAAIVFAIGGILFVVYACMGN